MMFVDVSVQCARVSLMLLTSPELVCTAAEAALGECQEYLQCESSIVAHATHSLERNHTF